MRKGKETGNLRSKQPYFLKLQEAVYNTILCGVRASLNHISFQKLGKISFTKKKKKTQKRLDVKFHTELLKEKR